MNRYRLNQILEVLLFPFSDPEMAKEDVLFLNYKEYQKFLEMRPAGATGAEKRKHQQGKYKRMQEKLVGYLIQRNHGKVKSKDDILMLCELYYPMSGIAQHMKEMKKRTEFFKTKYVEEECISIYYLTVLEKIADSLITYRDGVAAVRTWIKKYEDGENEDIFKGSTAFSKIAIWNLLCRFTAPDIYVAIAASKCGMGMEALYEQKSNISLADKLLIKCIQKGVAENHLHFNVGFDYEVVWLYQMDLDFVEEMEEKKEEWFSERVQAALFRCMAALFLNHDQACALHCKKYFRQWLENNQTEEINGIIDLMYERKYLGGLDQNYRKEVIALYYKLYEENSVREYDFLLCTVYQKCLEYKTSSEFLLLYQSYQYIKCNEEDTYFAFLFIQYLRIKNNYFQKVQQRNIMQGLKYFQGYYDTAKNNMKKVVNKEGLMLEVFRSQAKIENLKKLEIRIAPDVDGTDLNHFDYNECREILLEQLYEQIYMILYTYRRYILESIFGVKNTWRILKEEKKKGIGTVFDICQFWEHNIENAQVKIPTLGIVVHFLKADNLDDTSGYFCWKNAADSIGRWSFYRMTMRKFYINIATALEEMRSTIPKLNEYLVGIDAASDENALEPWVMAPVYKKMRSSKHTKPIVRNKSVSGEFQKIQNIGFTYHVGEDFRHIVSGMRHVDKVLEEFGFKAGDRLGHALVLGMNIEEWVRENEIIPIPLLEHLENLLWMWGKNTYDNLSLPIQLEVLENQIISIAEKIYNRPEGITVRMLYTAYKMKFLNDHESIAGKMQEELSNTWKEQSGKQRLKRNHTFCIYDGGDECYPAWTVQRLLLTNYCPVFENRYKKIELVSVSKDELTVYQMLQEYLIKKVEQSGIFIETNPTSNLTIGDFHSMKKHPIFYLNSKGGTSGHHALVTVNSDDPAVFNTNVENELAYIYYAAENEGYSMEGILNWIDKIRQSGMDASFIRNEKSARQILIEIETIMQFINEKRYEN